jgi:hypothetical protein
MIVSVKLVLTTIFWGGTFVAARAIAQEMGPFSASFLRFYAASLFLVALLLRMEGEFPRLRRFPHPSPFNVPKSTPHGLRLSRALPLDILEQPGGIQRDRQSLPMQQIPGNAGGKVLTVPPKVYKNR